MPLFYKQSPLKVQVKILKYFWDLRLVVNWDFCTLCGSHLKGFQSKKNIVLKNLGSIIFILVFLFFVFQESFHSMVNNLRGAKGQWKWPSILDTIVVVIQKSLLVALQVGMVSNKMPIVPFFGQNILKAKFLSKIWFIVHEKKSTLSIHIRI